MMMEGGTALYGNLYVLASPWIAPTRDLPCSGKQVQTMVMVMVMVMVISEMVMMIGMMMRMGITKNYHSGNANRG